MRNLYLIAIAGMLTLCACSGQSDSGRVSGPYVGGVGGRMLGR